MLLHILDGFYPVEWTFVQRQRSMLFVGMFGSWRVDTVVSRTEETEDEEKETNDNEGINNGGVD